MTTSSDHPIVTDSGPQGGVPWTPGPWAVMGDGVTVAQARKKWRTHVCRAFEIYGIRSEREANARLLAAAPSLFLALRCAREALAEVDADYRSYFDDPERLEDVIWMADQALALATKPDPADAGRAWDGEVG